MSEVGQYDHLDMISLADIDLESKLAAPLLTNNNVTSLALPTTTASPPASSSTLPMGYWSVPTLATMPAFATSALSALRGRLLGIPSDNATEEAPSSRRDEEVWPVVSAVDDTRLIEIGRRALRGTFAVHEVGDAPVQATPETVPPDAIVRAARKYFSECSADDLRLGELPALMRDYRRMAVVGWAALLEQGPEALVRPDVEFPGRYVHLIAEDIRLKEVDGILQDYRHLSLITKL